MEGFVIFCFTLLCVASIGNAAICVSTEGCPGNGSVCTVNCSEVAISFFNQPASHGNCRITLTSEGTTIQGCFINECNTTHPELCIPEIFDGSVAIGCCCSEDLCNSQFDLPTVETPTINSTATADPTTTTTTTDPTPTAPGEMHIYSTYPTHVTSDELVCIYQRCSTGDCSIKYEVCSENPLYENYTVPRHICYAVFIVNTDTGSYVPDRHCFDDTHTLCPEECMPVLHSYLSNDEAFYDCCCVGNLCNNVTYNNTDETPTVSPTATVDPSPTTPGETHIYSAYPTHAASDELVCIYQDCATGDCSIKYEVCSENPLHENDTVARYICYAVFVVNTENGSYVPNRHCFDDRDSLCPEECVPTLHSNHEGFTLYDCCCVGNLCNNVTFNINAVTAVSDSMALISPMTTFSVTPTTVKTSSDHDNSKHIPALVGGIVGGVCLIVLAVIVVMLAYCYLYRGDRIYNKFTS